MDDPVKDPVLLLDSLYQMTHRGRISHVHLPVADFRAQGFQLPERRFSRGLQIGAPGENQRRSGGLGRDFPGENQTQPSSAPGNQIDALVLPQGIRPGPRKGDFLQPRNRPFPPVIAQMFRCGL